MRNDEFCGVFVAGSKIVCTCFLAVLDAPFLDSHPAQSFFLQFLNFTYPLIIPVTLSSLPYLPMLSTGYNNSSPHQTP